MNGEHKKIVEIINKNHENTRKEIKEINKTLLKFSGNITNLSNHIMDVLKNQMYDTKRIDQLRKDVDENSLMVNQYMSELSGDFEDRIKETDTIHFEKNGK